MPLLHEPPQSADQEALYEEDVREDGFVWDATRLWAHQPLLHERFMGLARDAATAAGLTRREMAMLVLGTASTRGDSYCSVAWGRYLTEWAGGDVALAALEGDTALLTDRERTLLAWAGTIARDPNRADADDIETLRDVGFDEAAILALTLYAALRMALSTTNDALGARPDVALADMLLPAVRAAITWGRPPG